MKILYLTNQFYLHGGIEKILSQKINYLIEEYGYDVVLCTSEHKEYPFVYPLHKKLTHIDLGINYNRSKSYFHPQNLLKTRSHFKALKATIQKEQPDLIISVNTTPEQYLIPFIEKQIPKIKEFHSSGAVFSPATTFFSKLKAQLFNLFSRYDCLVVLNDSEKKYYPFEGIRVIPNFIAFEADIPIFNKQNTIIAAGRLAAVKQFDHLIKAWHLIAHHFPDWQVKIYGDGDADLLTTYKGVIAELKVSNIEFMGATAQLHKEMRKAKIFAMTSATECFPMVLLEAQASKMAILSYDCPNGPRHIIKHNETGVLSPYNDVTIFSENLAALIRDPEKTETLSAQAIIDIETFSATEVMGLWQKLFKELVG